LHDFRPISRYISQTIQDSDIVTTIEGEDETALELSNGTSQTSNPDFKVTILFNAK